MFGVLATLGPASLPANAEPVSLDATFEHKASIPYRSALFGRVTLALDTAPGGATAAFRLGLGEETCRLAMMWGPAAPAGPNVSLSPTAPFEACLTGDHVDEAALDAWRHGHGFVDPALVVPLVNHPQRPGHLVNAAALRGQLFVRDCRPHAAGHRRLADVTVKPAALQVATYEHQLGGREIAFLATGVELTPVDARTWQDIVRGCGNGQVLLPEEPAAGSAPWLFGSTERLTPVGDAIHQSLDEIRVRVEDLSRGEAIARDDAVRLIRPIDHADASRRQGHPLAAVSALDRLERETEVLVRVGALAPDTAKILVAGATEARAEILDSVLGVVGVVPDPACGAQKPCAPTTMYVDARTTVPKARQDGSALRPFASIAAALEAAGARQACAVVVVVAPGTYSEGLRIVQDTAIVGAPLTGARFPTTMRGAVESDGAHSLAIENVRFLETPGPAIRVAHACARTTLRRVSIESALDFGIDVDGGAFSMTLSRVASTRGRITVPSSGVGVQLRGGARAALTSVELVDNDGQGLAVVGEHTKAFGRAVTVAGNRYLVGLFGLQGAVSVLDGALLLMESSTIEDSERIGLLSANHAHVHFRAGRITRTREDTSPPPLDRGGFNVHASVNAIVELSTFTSSRADFVGLSYASGSLGAATDGEVSGNAIGLHTADTPIAPECLIETVHYVDNERAFDGTSLPAPDVTPPDLDDSTPPPVCASVPFVCDWCAPE